MIIVGRSFGKSLQEDYFDGLEEKLHTLYVSDGYVHVDVFMLMCSC